MSDSSDNDDYLDYDPDELDFEDRSEPIGSCDECGTNLYEDDCWEVGGYELCNQCAWHALGCPGPGDEVDEMEDEILHDHEDVREELL